MNRACSRTKIGIIFDDGFRKSSIATAELFESFGLRAVFAVIADHASFHAAAGEFALWNELQSRGHIIHPHGQTHVKLSDIPPQQAIGSVRQCLDTFQQKLNGFDPKQAVYATTYNIGTPETIEWLLPRVRGVRIGGDPFLSADMLASRVWTSTAFGPGDPAQHFIQHLDEARQRRPAALLYCLHGLDGELWGAIARDSLRQILETITTDPAFEYWPLT
jgi:peptidoglycan/xylan/chitin deacetylase (PgdA/CDA1 family)